jgi:uncharacterized membrane protein YhhN
MEMMIFLSGMAIVYAVLFIRFLKVAYVDELRLLPQEYHRAEKSKEFTSAMHAKITLSILFCVAGAVGIGWNLLHGKAEVGDFFIMAGLICAAFGDYFLQYIRVDYKKFNIGILCFALTQICLLAFLLTKQKFGWPELIVTIVILVLVLILMKYQKWNLGKAQGPLSVYTVLLTLMTSKAVTLAVTSLGIQGKEDIFVFAVGAVLFLLSDLVLGIWNYHSNRHRDANWNWITYFAAMFLIAASISIA